MVDRPSPLRDQEKRADERIVDTELIPWIDRYLEVHRPVLARRTEASNALWLSSNNGRPMSICGVEDVISKTTLAAVGIKVSPHLFRTAGVSTVAVYAGNNPHLGSALLHQRDPSMREKHYNRASSLSATQNYSALVRALRKGSATTVSTVNRVEVGRKDGRQAVRIFGVAEANAVKSVPLEINKGWTPTRITRT
jgi:hypothetical protein